MEIDISGRHFHVNESLRDMIREKIQKLDKYSQKIESAHVILEIQKFLHTAEIVLRGKHLHVKSKADSTDMYAAFDKSFGNIQLQMRKLHEKLKDHKAKRPEPEE